VLLASWNVNSIRARLDRALAWLDRVQPDVLCMQETKVVNDHFPLQAFADKGYEAAIWGQKTYNGVAILSRSTPQDVQRGFGDTSDEEARLLGASIDGVRVYSCYVPNGKVIGTPAAEEKLLWLDRLGQLLATHSASERVVACGDFNIAWDDRDVHDPAFWRTQVLYHPSMQKALHGFAESAHLVDTFRLHHDEAQRYSWWDYRMLGFPKNRGLRIDYIFASRILAEACSDAFIDREERKGKSPSDHAPVLAQFDL
jgi:exodeoxyribonuclease-3